MKNFRKILSLLLALLTTFAFAACAAESSVDTPPDDAANANPADTATEAPETDYLETLSESAAYLNGKTFRILDANDHIAMHINISSGEYTGSAVNDGLYDRDMFIEQNYGVDLVYEQIQGTDTGATAFKNSVAAGDGGYDIIIGQIATGLSSLATSGTLANLGDLTALSLDSVWWSPLLYDSLRIGDKMYYTTGDIAPSMYDSPNCILFNTTLADEYNVKDDFFKIVRDGKWTWDKLRSIANEVYTDVDGDGTIIATKDTLGFGCANIVLTTNGLASSVGVKLATVNNDGTVSVDISGENSMMRLGALNGLFDEYTTCADEEFKVSFTEGRILFYNHLIETARYRCRDMEDDYILLPMPKFDEAQENYINMINPWVSCFVGAAKTADAALTGPAMELMAFISHRDIYPIVYDVMLKSRVAANSETAEMIDLIFSNIYIDFNAVYDFGGSMTALRNYIIDGTELASSLAKIDKVMNKTIEDFTKNWNGTEE